MLWKDIVTGFVIAGLLAIVVPPAWWQQLFLIAAPGWARLLAFGALALWLAVLARGGAGAPAPGARSQS